MTGLQGCTSGGQTNTASPLPEGEINLNDYKVPGKTETAPSEERLTVNGVDIEKYRIVVKSKSVDSYGSAATVLQHYLSRYRGYNVEIADEKAEPVQYEIFIGKSERNPEKYDLFTSQIFCRDGKIYLCGGNRSDCEQVVNAFIAKFLDGKNEVKISDDGEIAYISSGEPDWSKVPKCYTLQDKIVRSCKKIQHISEYDTYKGYKYTYKGSDYKSNFDDARMSLVLVTNCVIVMNWALKDTGLWKKGNLNHLYDGTCGYTFGSDECKKAMLDNFDILKIPEGKTLRDLNNEGNLLPGDLIFFTNHNQIIIDGSRALDGGRGNTYEVSVGSEFKYFVGTNMYMGSHAGYIFRAKDAEPW